jgi:hypothetical protein
MTWWPRNAGVATLLLILAGSAGCGTSQDADVRSSATTFYEAADSGEGADACALLAPRTRSELEQSSGQPCAEAIAAEPVPQVDQPTDIRAFGPMAQVRYHGETTFLTRFQDGWRVVAAACTPGPADVYDCRISGG